jgi:hypothetical protein
LWIQRIKKERCKIEGLKSSKEGLQRWSKTEDRPKKGAGKKSKMQDGKSTDLNSFLSKSVS